LANCAAELLVSTVASCTPVILPATPRVPTAA
jgi:hypothetical protein